MKTVRDLRGGRGPLACPLRIRTRPIKFADGKLGYVGSCWTSPGVFAVRVFGSKGLMHYEIDFGTWDTPSELHKTSTLYIQRGKDGYGKREVLAVAQSDMFRAELEMFAESCRTGTPNELSARNGNVAVAVVYAALRSIEKQGQAVRIAEVIAEATPASPKGAAMLPSRFFADLTQPEIAAQFKRNPLVILPAGSVEQHGPHLPTGTDTLAANVIAQRGRGAHGRSRASLDAARRHPDAYAIRGHHHAHARHLYARGDRDLRAPRPGMAQSTCSFSIGTKATSLRSRLRPRRCTATTG